MMRAFLGLSFLCINAVYYKVGNGAGKAFVILELRTAGQ